jgi:nitrogen fixation/metabolism regulation signal transduction histidine kinase
MSRRIRVRRKDRILIAVIGIFILYFAAVIYFSFAIDPFTFLQEVTGNRLLLGSVILLFTLMLLLVVYNLVQIISDRLRNNEGSRFRLRLTVFFLTVTLIPVVPVALVSNNVISSSINMWFVKGVEEALVEALDISKELYNRLSLESVDEWQEATSGLDPGEIDPGSLQYIDGVYGRGDGGELLPLFLKDPGLHPLLIRALGRSEVQLGAWKRLTVGETGEVLISMVSGPSASWMLVRRLEPDLVRSTSAVSQGLQNYRTLKVVRAPIKGVVLLSFAFISLPFLLLAIYVSLTISREVTGPIRELAIATRKVADDDLDFQIDLKAKDEIRQLISSFNDMTRELRVNRELLKHSERFAAWQEIARKIAHEIKNPLTPIKLSAERILRMYNENDLYAHMLTKGMQTIISEVENINQMVNEFSRFTRFPETQLGEHDMVELVGEVIEFLKHTCSEVTFEFYHPEERIYLRIDRMQIRRALLNIVYNGINAMSGRGAITIECYPSVEGDRKKRDRYIVAVTDSGTGIDPEIRDTIFDPYVTKNGSGSGLGLAIVDKIVLDNRGRIWFESVPGKTTFYMEFEKA